MGLGSGMGFESPLKDNPLAKTILDDLEYKVNFKLIVSYTSQCPFYLQIVTLDEFSAD
jgi:hypothetical protein